MGRHKLKEKSKQRAKRLTERDQAFAFPTASQRESGSKSEKLRIYLWRHFPLILVMALTISWEIMLWRHAQPNVFPDSWTYGMLGKALLEGNLSHELFSFRTPGFPGFLALIFAVAGPDNWQAVINVQFFLGTLVPVGLYLLFLPFTKRPWLAAVGAGAYLLDRYFLGLQTVPLTEFLGGVLCVYILAWQVWAWKRCRWGEAALLGFVTGLWILVRPSFQLLPWCLLGLGLSLALWDYRKKKELLKRVVGWHLAYLVGWQLPLLCWSANVYRFTGHWGLSHQLGASLTNHTGAFMEYAPDEAGPLKTLYVAEKQKRGGDWINNFDALHKQLEAATNLPLWEVSLRYKEIDKFLLKRFWRQYLNQVALSWQKLWSEPSSYLVDESSSEIDPRSGRGKTLPHLIYLQNTVLGRVIYLPLDKRLWFNRDTAPKLPYMILALLAGLLLIRRKDSHAVFALLAIVGTVFYHMIIHAAVQFTEWGRYRLPVQPLWWGFLFCGFAVLAYEIYRGIAEYFRDE